MKSNSISYHSKKLYIFFLFLSLNIFFFSTTKVESKPFDIDNIDTALGKRNISQNGFVYSRRAEQNEGFKIREGCG